MIYSKENISIAVEILQNLYHPNYNVPIEVVADAILWEFDEDYEDAGYYPNLRDGAAVAWMPLPSAYQGE